MLYDIIYTNHNLHIIYAYQISCIHVMVSYTTVSQMYMYLYSLIHIYIYVYGVTAQGIVFRQQPVEEAFAVPMI